MSSHSALLGQPPASDDDTTIVRAWFVFIGKAGKDPSNGFSLLPRPLQNQYHYESRGPAIIAYNVVFTLIMLVVTGWRICLRIQNYKLRFGWDDWGIILATVSYIDAKVKRLQELTHGIFSSSLSSVQS